MLRQVRSHRSVMPSRARGRWEFGCGFCLAGGKIQTRVENWKDPREGRKEGPAGGFRVRAQILLRVE